MQKFPTTPLEMFRSFWRNRGLIKVLVHREVVGRYRGSMMGLLWSLFHPLFMLAVYTFVFSVVFKARWNGGSESKMEFALILFAGLIVFNFFADCINRAPNLILSNTNYVKKVVFPLEILSWVVVGAAGFHAFVSLIVWVCVYIVIYGAPHLTILFFPMVVLPLVLLVMGLGWGLASLGVYLRDAGQIVGILTTVLMFISPIFFPASALPENYRDVLMLNPLTPIIEQTRNVLFWGKAPDMSIFSTELIVSSIVAWLGFVWFQKTRRGFADVL